MKKMILVLGTVCFFLIGLSGCSSTPDKPVVKTTNKFNVESISLQLVELIIPDIEYHTNDEVEALVAKGIMDNLEKADLISTDSSMNSLEIKMTYHRRFLGDATPIPSDSLAYPNFDYDIKIKDGGKLIKTISRKNLIYTGGFVMNLKLIAGTLRDKSDEVQFIDALSRTVANSIEELN